MKDLAFLSDNDLEMIAPVIRADQSVVTTGTCTGRLFDVRRDDSLASTNAGAILTLKGKNAFQAGETAYLLLDDKTIHTSLIDSVDPVLKTITLNSAPASPASARTRVLRQIGPVVSMAVFNAVGADPETEDWGFRGLIADDHVEIEFNMVCRAEMLLDDGATRKVIRNIKLRFTEIEE